MRWPVPGLSSQWAVSFRPLSCGLAGPGNPGVLHAMLMQGSAVAELGFLGGCHVILERFVLCHRTAPDQRDRQPKGGRTSPVTGIDPVRIGYLFLIRYSRNEGAADDVRPVPIITDDDV